MKEELNAARFNDAELTIYKNCNWLISKSVSGKINPNDDLDKGEMEAIALAKELHADYLLIDEKAGRKAAMKEGLRIIGVVGLLILAKQKGLIKEVKILLDDLIAKSDFWISERLNENILLHTGEL
ncbi:MAG TPA: DUF3368 domain-containing protein [Chitinophagales bacterium]|nr:DUF3368 domain-containing protein [Chitinophagales bacterium]